MTLLNFTDHTRQQKLITLMYLSTILALYFEHFVGVTLLFFLGGMIWLSFQKNEPSTLSSVEKNWINISLLYAGVMIASFFVHLPITEDGIWRLSSYAFIILMSGMFYLQTRIKVTKQMLFSVILFSVLCAFIVFAIEFFHYGLNLFLNNSIRLGQYAAIDTGGYAMFTMGTLIILPIFFAFNLSPTIKKLIVSILLLTLLFVLLGRGRTSIWYFAIVVIVFSWFSYHSMLKTISKKQVISIVAFSLFSILSVLTITHNRIFAAYEDISHAIQENYDSSLGHRIIMYNIGSEIVLDHPLFGVGLSHFKEEKINHLAQHDFHLSEQAQNRVIGYTQIHNQFLMDSIFSGFFGLISVILFIFYPLKLYINFYIDTNNKNLKIIAISGALFVGYALFTSLFGCIFTYTYTSIFYMLINGLLINYLLQYKEDYH